MARQPQTATEPAQQVLSRSLAEQISAAIRQATQRADGELARSPAVHAAVSSCPGARRQELEEFIRRVDDLTRAEQLEFAEALHPVQVPSKLWLIDELARRRDLSTATLLVLGAWYGILPVLLEWRLEAPPLHTVCVDVDADVCQVAGRVVGSLYERVEFLCADAMTLDYVGLARDPSLVVVNTICEHLRDLEGWWSRVPEGQFTVLQSNNYAGCPDHVNPVTSLKQLKRQTPLSTTLFEGVLSLPQLDRYMLIGYR